MTADYSNKESPTTLTLKVALAHLVPYTCLSWFVDGSGQRQGSLLLLCALASSL